MDDIAQLAQAAAAAIGASVLAYGHAVIMRAEDQAADGTVRLGQRLLARLRSRDSGRPVIDRAVRSLARDPSDAHKLGYMRQQIQRALDADPQLVLEVRDLLARGAASGASYSAISVEQNDGIISTGSHATNKVIRDGI